MILYRTNLLLNHTCLNLIKMMRGRPIAAKILVKVRMMKRMSIMMNLRERIRGVLQHFPDVNEENVHS